MGTAVVLSYPTHGHIAPALGVVAELVRRGERVIFYATERSREKIEATGAEFRSYARRHDEFSPTPPTDGLFSDMARLIALTEELLPGLLNCVEEDAPDYLLIDTKSVWGRLAAQVLGIPAVTLSVVFAIRPEVVPVTDLVNLLYGGAPEDKLRAGLTSLSRYLEVARRIGKRHGSCTPGIIEYLGNPHPLNIIFTSREFQVRGNDFGNEFKFVGPSIPPAREAAHDFPLDRIGPLPLVYISLGTTFNDAPDFYRACFQAFAGAPWQVVLSAGAGRGDLGHPPPNFIVRDYVPQLSVLKRAGVFITHGGMNSANEGLYHGVPLVVVPQRGDQNLVAARVAELGAGVCLAPGEVTPWSLRDAVSRVFADTNFRSKARSIGKTLQDAGGYERAANEILGFAGDGQVCPVSPSLQYQVQPL